MQAGPGELLSISANVVYERDLFDYELGDEERITHKPSVGDRGAPIAAYAIARLKGGGIEREVMSWRDIMQVREMGAERGPWATWPAEMARKTVIRRLYKRLPSSTEMDRYLSATPAVERELSPTLADTLKHAPLPDPASLESSTFHLIADARLAISEADSAEAVRAIWSAAVLGQKMLRHCTKGRIDELINMTSGLRIGQKSSFSYSGAAQK